MKHYPITVDGIKASACIASGWEWATISIKVSHRKGQRVILNHTDSNLVSHIWVDEYPTYTAIRFSTKQNHWNRGLEALKYCASLIQSISVCIDFNAEEALITKELLTILG